MFRDDDNQHQVALIHFERESAAKTATLLSNGKHSLTKIHWEGGDPD